MEAWKSICTLIQVIVALFFIYSTRNLPLFENTTVFVLCLIYLELLYQGSKK